MTLYRNAWHFIPLTMIPLTVLSDFNAIGRADLSRRNLISNLPQDRARRFSSVASITNYRRTRGSASLPRLVGRRCRAASSTQPRW